MNQIYQPEYSRHCDRLAKRAGERPLLNYSTMEMTYEEWLKLAEDSYNTDTGARCTETFAALAEKTCGLPSDMDERPKVRQPGIRVLPFTHSIFKSICDSFQVHGSVIKSITRTDQPSFAWEKVFMGKQAHGKSLRTRRKEST
jgi:hypothetical protein